MKTTNENGGYRAESIGVLALHHISNSRRWQVLCVYRSCLYCQNDSGDIICIGTDRIGRGPITISGKSLAPFLQTEISAGDVIFSESGCLDFKNSCCVIDVRMAEIWDTQFYASPDVRPELERDIQRLIEMARLYAPRESLGRLIPVILSDSLWNSVAPAAESPLSQLLFDRVVSVMKRILHAETCSRSENTAENLTDCLAALIGTGFGLTPSGDDFCSGVVLGNALLGDSRKAREMARLMKQKAAGKTTRISYAYYTALAESYLSESSARLLECFGNSHSVDLEAILLDCADHGATSGWDMLAGFAFSLKKSIHPRRRPEIVLRPSGSLIGYTEPLFRQGQRGCVSTESPCSRTASDQ